ncbi:amino acid adenylation domain-containing protein [Kitasatospora sp. NPDC059577]|uniref:amino acid adenylation domain-containing protein n=1 Tax=Kitasatospora sp. NPDC059577 TaxID=3346873 RepID=UPI0036B4D647
MTARSAVPAPVELRRYLADATGPDRPYPLDRCVHQLFERQARRTPDAVALVCDGVELDYAGLNARANRLAHRLRAAGAGPESLVGVRLERGTDLVVALLGVLKSGAGYVPLDPEHPPLRTAAVLAESGAALLVTDAAAAAAAEHAGVRPVVPDDEPGWPAHDPAPAADPDNPAYAIFTSGSTGRPKGVLVPHRGVVNRLLWMRDDCGLTGGSRVLQKTPATFDVSVWEFFGPLAVGATLVLARPGGHRDPAYLYEVLTGQRVDTVHFVPSMLREFLADLRARRDHGGPPVLPALRRIVCSGEALGPDLVREVHQLLDCELFNLYGPTEAAVDVTAERCLPGAPVTIGRAVANTRAYVLDPDGVPAPPGTPGELCLAGVQLARGYLGRPGATAAAFRPDPHGPPGARLYRTGDLARRRVDGRIEYLGRLDHQVKIRGLRIELGDVETALAAHPQVHAAVVAAHPAATGGSRLVGYLVGAVPDVPDLPDLRKHLGELLPDYMIPTAWVRLAELPLTASGKTDRKALPAPDDGRPELATAYLAPRTPTERTLVGIWEQALGVAPIGVRDRFLDLGGQSLIATRICSRLRARTGAAPSPADLLARPTVEDLAALLDAAGPAPAPQDLRTVPPRPPGPVPLSSEQHRLWFLDRLTPGSTEYTMYDAHRLRGPVDPAALHEALRATVRRHAALRTTFEARRGVPHQVVHPDPPTAPEVVDLTGTPPDGREEAARRAVRAQVERPFALDRGPLLRLVLLTLEPDHHVLLAVVHHIVADDWSMGVFWRDLSEGYRAARAGRAPRLPALPVDYPDYAAWQRSGAGAADRTEDDLDHWLRHLRAPLPALELPGGPRPPLRGRRDAVVDFTLPAAVTTALNRTAGEAGATPFMALLSCFSAVLAGACGTEDLVVATFTANRPMAELADLVGLFVNTLALRTPVGRREPFTQVLARTRATALAAYRHQGLPFDRVVTALRPPRDPSRNPVAQAGFQLLGPLAGRVDLPGTTAEPYDHGQGGHPFDVLVDLRENGAALDGRLHYPQGLLGDAAARDLAGAFTGFVAAAAERPGLPVERLG